MTSLNWRSLIVETERRSAIYAETFPADLTEALADAADPAAALEAFDNTAALEVLSTFAGAWGALHRDPDGTRWQYRPVVTAAGSVEILAFRARPLDPDEQWVLVVGVHRPI